VAIVIGQRLDWTGRGASSLDVLNLEAAPRPERALAGGSALFGFPAESTLQVEAEAEAEEAGNL
jgi:hypothetical protein